MSKKSPLWKYFSISEDDGKYAVCSLCAVKLSRGGEGKKAGTSSMKNHLKNKHLEKFGELFGVHSCDASTTSPVSVAVIQGPTKPTVNLLSDRSPFDYLIGEMIALDKEPISIVERVGFNRLLKKALPKYNIPTLDYITEQILPEIYDRIRAKIRDRISNAVKLSITSDEWSCNGKSFMSLTAHWLSKEFELQHAILNTQQYLGYNTEASIVNQLRLVAETWHVPIEKLHILVHNCENDIKSEIIPEYVTAACFICYLQRIVSESIKSQSSVLEMFQSARLLVAFYNIGALRALAQNTLRLAQKSLNLPEKPLVGDTDTRWISTYYMLERLFEQKRAISECNLNQLTNELSLRQWSLLEQYIRLLKPFEVLAKNTSSGFSCISEIIPNIVTLLKYLDKDETARNAPELENFMASLKNQLQNVTYQETEFHIATFLDPRFKTSFLTSNQTDRVQERITVIIRNTDYFNRTVELLPSKRKRPEAFWDCFEEATDQNEDNVVTIDHEIDLYTKSARIDRRGDPYAWWAANSEQYPFLATLARIYLSSPCSSIYEESLYSEPGIDYENKRSRLVPTEDVKLMFIHNNLPLVDFKY